MRSRISFGLQRWSEGRGNGCYLRGGHTAAGGGSTDIDKRQVNKGRRNWQQEVISPSKGGMQQQRDKKIKN